MLSIPNSPICITYGVNPPDLGEAKYNQIVARQVFEALVSVGLVPEIMGIANNDHRPLPPLDTGIFNLCDGDEDDRFGMVSFATEISNRRYTGSSFSALALAKDKTLSWVRTAKIPQFWDNPPEDKVQKYFIKPRAAHGSLLISNKNVCGDMSQFDNSYFCQELLEGPEYTVCFLGSEFLGISKLHAEGIITRDQKWDDVLVVNPPKRTWDLLGDSEPNVKEQAILAWKEMLSYEPEVERRSLAYGRVDIRMDIEGTPYVIDLNPNAYLGKDGLLYSCWRASGRSYEELILNITKPLLEA